MNWVTANARLKAVSLMLAVGTWFFVKGITSDSRVVENVPLEIRVKSGMTLVHSSATTVTVVVRGTREDIRQSSRGWLAFDPKGLVGERTYDCANTLCNPVMPELVHNETRLLTNASILADRLSLDPWRVLAFTYAYACLNASWWLQLGGDDIVQWMLKVAEIIEPHIEPLVA